MTIPHDIDPFRVLREAQVRSAQTQQIFSGRDWLCVATFIQFITAIYPLYQWMSFDLLGYRQASADPVVSILRLIALAILGIGFVFLLLSWWAKYAPFRAATLALLFYTALNILLAVTRPQFFMEGFASRMFVLLGLIMAVRTGFHRHRAR